MFSFQVYNWQYVNSLRLWQNLLSETCNKPQLQPLIYPFVQVCIGTLKLVPTAQYFPLRLHLTQILIDLSKDTDIFIPVLPFLLEVRYFFYCVLLRHIFLFVGFDHIRLQQETPKSFHETTSIYFVIKAFKVATF